MYNAPFLVLQNTARTESCVSRRNNETRYAGFVACFSIIHDIWSLFPIFFFFFSFSNCLDPITPRFRVATSSLSFPPEFPRPSYNYWFEGENFHFHNLSNYRDPTTQFFDARANLKETETILESSIFLLTITPYFSNISWNLREKRKEKKRKNVVARLLKYKLWIRSGIGVIRSATSLSRLFSTGDVIYLGGGGGGEWDRWFR